MITIKGKTLALLIAMHEGSDEELTDKILQQAVVYTKSTGNSIIQIDVGMDLNVVDEHILKGGLVKLIPLLRDGIKGLVMSKLNSLYRQ